MQKFTPRAGYIWICWNTYCYVSKVFCFNATEIIYTRPLRVHKFFPSLMQNIVKHIWRWISLILKSARNKLSILGPANSGHYSLHFHLAFAQVGSPCPSLKVICQEKNLSPFSFATIPSSNFLFFVRGIMVYYHLKLVKLVKKHKDIFGETVCCTIFIIFSFIWDQDAWSRCLTYSFTSIY